MAPYTQQKTVVIGAGPVGALAALYAAQRGDAVEVYELRDDDVLAETIPMHGRMIHGEERGKLYEQSQTYDVRGRFIRAVDRAGLNKSLLDELEKMPNVTFYFNHKLTGADFNRKIAWFEQRSKPKAGPRPPEIEIKFDFMIGADGAHSAVRFHLMKYARMTYQQEYIETLWCEFRIDPSLNGTFRLSPNHLHIWPGQEFMFIAIPSLDNSFTSTLFLPASHFAELDGSPSSLVDFFKDRFPGVVPDLISEADLVKQYSENPHLPLINIKCAPFHYSSSVAILGDAAHAMVPFYGQGMNAGLEDVRVLYDFLDAYRPSPGSLPGGSDGMRERALAEFSNFRTRDAHVINDLALRNYQEMRSDVTSPIYKLRKWIEEKISIHVPLLGWATQYSRISFTNERYSEVERKAQRQGRILIRAMTMLSVGVVSGVSWWAWRWGKKSGIGGRLAHSSALLGSNLIRDGKGPI
ncbi:MAG: hypothetical protein Q9165_001930 [Trypethelium subeluteriae]